MRNVFIVTLALLAVSASASELTLQQALDLAETHSNSRKRALANSAAADESVRAAQAERYPTLSATAYATFVDEIPELNIAFPPLFTLRRKIGSKERYQADVQLTLPLYTGGRIGSAVAMARANRTYWQALESQDLNALQYATRAEFFGLHRSLKMREAAQAALHRTAIIQMDIRSMFEAGAADSVDVLEADLAFTSADYTARQADIAVRTAEIHLLTRLGLPETERLALADTIPEPPLDMPTYAESGLRPEVLAAEAGIGLSRAQVRREQAGWFPTLAAFGGYSYGKPNQDQFTVRWNDYFSVGATATWAFNLGFQTRTQVSKAKLELKAAEHYHGEISEAVARQGQLAYEQLRLAHEQYLKTREELAIARSNYALAQTRHREGALSSNRLLEIQAVLAQAEAALAAAVADYYIAESAHLYAIGSANLGKGL